MKRIITALFLFMLVSTIFLTGLYYTQEVVGDAVIGNFSQAGQDLTENQTYADNIAELGNKYIGGDAKFNYDYLFIVGFFVFEISLILISIISPKLPKWVFLTFLVFFSLMFVFAYSFVADINIWIYENYITSVFDAEDTFMPWFNYVINNQITIVFISFVSCLGLNFIFGRENISNPFTGGAP